MSQTEDKYDDHHDGRSDATPGGYANERRPGELIFTLFLVIVSAILLLEAYGISGFKKLSSPGVIPMATTGVMLVTGLIILFQTVRLPKVATETIAKDILPVVVIVFVAILAGFSFLLKPLGFVPSAFMFLVFSIKFLSRRNWAYVLGLSLLTLVGIWLIFRVVFSVLMPAGVFPEAELIQFFRTLFVGAE